MSAAAAQPLPATGVPLDEEAAAQRSDLNCQDRMAAVAAGRDDEQLLPLPVPDIATLLIDDGLQGKYLLAAEQGVEKGLASQVLVKNERGLWLQISVIRADDCDENGKKLIKVTDKGCGMLKGQPWRGAPPSADAAFASSG